MSDAYRCTCGNHLEKVTQSANSMLNSEQFYAARMGDWFCRRCPTNEGKNRYFWDSDIAALAVAPVLDYPQQITRIVCKPWLV